MDNSALAETYSPKHEAFLASVLNGVDPAIAGKNAGFANPSRDAYPLLADHRVRMTFRKRLRGRAETEGAAAGYAYIIAVVRDESLDKRLRLDAAKFLYSQAVPAPKAVETPSDDDKSPSEMSTEELRKFIEQGEAELANRAEPVNAPADIPQTLDSL